MTGHYKKNFFNFKFDLDLGVIKAKIVSFSKNCFYCPFWFRSHGQGFFFSALKRPGFFFSALKRPGFFFFSAKKARFFFSALKRPYNKQLNRCCLIKGQGQLSVNLPGQLL